MIGVFDSGSGGLTVLKALQQKLPDQDFLYYGDHRNAPYGHRSNEQIVELTRAGVDVLMKAGCKLVILACNTAAAVALRTLQQNWLSGAYPENRILGVLVPMVEAITGVPWKHKQTGSDFAGKILLFATQKTVASGAYREEVTKRAPKVELTQKACPGLVDAIEGGAGPAPLGGLIDGYVNEVATKQASVAVLGCTHFPLVEPYFRAALPTNMVILSQPDIVASSLTDYLQRHTHFVSPGTGAITLLTSGDPEMVNQVSSQFLGQNLRFRVVPVQ